MLSLQHELKQYQNLFSRSILPLNFWPFLNIRIRLPTTDAPMQNFLGGASYYLPGTSMSLLWHVQILSFVISFFHFPLISALIKIKKFNDLLKYQIFKLIFFIIKFRKLMQNIGCSWFMPLKTKISNFTETCSFIYFIFIRCLYLLQFYNNK